MRALVLLGAAGGVGPSGCPDRLVVVPSRTNRVSEPTRTRELLSIRYETDVGSSTGAT